MKTVNNILNFYIFFYNNNLLFLDNRISIIDKILIIFNNCLNFIKLIIINLIYNYLIYSYTTTKMLYYLYININNINILKNKIFNTIINHKYFVHNMNVKQ